MKTKVDGYIEVAQVAQKELETYSQEKIDQIVDVIADLVFDRAETYAKLAVEDTKMGNVPDKIMKCHNKSANIKTALTNKKSRGILRYIRSEGLVEIAKPMGVVASIIPATNPIVTAMCNAMFSIKGGNSIIVTPSRRTRRVSQIFSDDLRKKLLEIEVNPDIYQCMQVENLDETKEMMQKADVVIATGGPAMVKSAYSSGKPSFGVGAGNVQVLIDRLVNVPSKKDRDEEVLDARIVSEKIIRGRTFDNGIICACEQNIIAHEDDCDILLDEFQKQNCIYFNNPSIIADFANLLFPDGKINKELVGKTAGEIIERASFLSKYLTEGELQNIFNNSKNIRVLLLEASFSYIMRNVDKYDILQKDQRSLAKIEATFNLLRKEKMFPVLAVYRYKTWSEAISIAYTNLKCEGIGHSISIHSTNQTNIEKAALKLPVSRTMVNQISATNVGGSPMNGLNPTTTIGCGSWGNNSISENLFYTHLFNVSRIAYANT